MQDKRVNLVISIFIYIFGMFLLGGIVGGVLVFYLSTKNDIPSENIIKAMTTLSEVQRENELAALTNAISNLFAYLFITVFLVFLLREYLVKDYKEKVKPNVKKFIITVVIGFVVFYGVSILAGLLSKENSENQQAIENIFKFGYGPIMMIATVLLAPFVEELIYRKVIFELFEKFKSWVPIVVSALLFMLPHMLQKSS